MLCERCNHRCAGHGALRTYTDLSPFYAKPNPNNVQGNPPSIVSAFGSVLLPESGVLPLVQTSINRPLCNQSIASSITGCTSKLAVAGQAVAAVKRAVDLAIAVFVAGRDQFLADILVSFISFGLAVNIAPP